MKSNRLAWKKLWFDEMNFILTPQIEDVLWENITQWKSITLSILKDPNPILYDHMLRACYVWEEKLYTLWHLDHIYLWLEWNDARLQLVWKNFIDAFGLKQYDLKRFIPWFMEMIDKKIEDFESYKTLEN